METVIEKSSCGLSISLEVLSSIVLNIVQGYGAEQVVLLNKQYHRTKFTSFRPTDSSTLRCCFCILSFGIWNRLILFTLFFTGKIVLVVDFGCQTDI